MEASIVYELVRELVEHGKHGRLGKAELYRVHFLMSQLRDCGFSSSDVSLLVGRRWDDSTIRKYGKCSGVVDVSGTNKLLSLVAGFADAGVDLAEVERCKAAKKVLDEVGLDFDSAAKLGRDLAACRGSVDSVESLSSDLAKEERTVAEVSERLKLDKELNAKGLTKGVQLKVLETALDFGEPEAFLEGLSGYKGLLNIRERVDKLEKEAAELDAYISNRVMERDKLDEECRIRSTEIVAVKMAAHLGFNVGNLTLISEESKDLGGPYGVLEAIKKYRTLKQLEAEIEEKRRELSEIKRDFQESLGYLNALKYTLAEAELEYKTSSDVVQVVGLLRNPRKFILDPVLVASVLVKVLERGLEIIKNRPLFLQEPSPRLTILCDEIGVLIEDLKYFINSKQPL